MSDDPNVYRDEDFPMGLRCPECGHLFADGERFATVPVAFQDDVPITKITCTSPECEIAAMTRGDGGAA